MARRKSYRNENQFLRSLDGIAYGLFCTRVLGQVMVMLGNLMNLHILSSSGSAIVDMQGIAIGIGVAYATGARGIVLLSSALAGYICQTGGVAWVLCAYLAVMVSVYIGEFLRNKTPIDIFLTPIVTIAFACVVSSFVEPYLNIGVSWALSQISVAESFSPLFMGMFIAMIMSILCITPLQMYSLISIAGLSSLACGAALAGTCSAMLGLAMMSIDDNDLGDVIAVGIGTPVLQFKNCLKNPLILIPILVSALITGPLASALFKLHASTYGASVGMMLFEGPITSIQMTGVGAYLGMAVVYIMLPILITFSTYKALKHLGWIRGGDLNINHL